MIIGILTGTGEGAEVDHIQDLGAEEGLQTVSSQIQWICLFVCLVALRPKSTAMVIAGGSVHLTTLFPGQA